MKPTQASAADKFLDAAKALRDTLRLVPDGPMTHEEVAFQIMVWLRDRVNPAIAVFDATLEELSVEGRKVIRYSRPGGGSGF